MSSTCFLFALTVLITNRTHLKLLTAVVLFFKTIDSQYFEHGWIEVKNSDHFHLTLSWKTWILGYPSVCSTFTYNKIRQYMKCYSHTWSKSSGPYGNVWIVLFQILIWHNTCTSFWCSGLMSLIQWYGIMAHMSLNNSLKRYDN